MASLVAAIETPREDNGVNASYISSLNWAAPKEPAEVVIHTCCAVTVLSSLK